LFARKRWAELEQWVAQSDSERIWQLLALAQRDLNTAGELLEKVAKDSTEIEVLHVLMRYYSSRGDRQSVDRIARQLTVQVDIQVQRWSSMAEHSLQAKDLKRAQTMIENISALNPEAEVLPALKKQYQQKRTASSSAVSARKVGSL